MPVTDDLQKVLEEAIEKGVQQRSAVNSDILSEIKELRREVGELRDEIDSWKFGGKLAIGLFVAIGALVTWVLNTLGLHLGLK